ELESVVEVSAVSPLLAIVIKFEPFALKVKPPSEPEPSELELKAKFVAEDCEDPPARLEVQLPFKQIVALWPVLSTAKLPAGVVVPIPTLPPMIAMTLL